MVPSTINLQPQIIYIGGTGRSGTNFLKHLLSQASEVYALPFEHRILIDPGGLVSFYHSFASAWSPYKADRDIHQLRDFLKRTGREPWGARILGGLLKALPGGITLPRYHGWNIARTFPDYFTEVDRLIDELVDFRFAGYWPGSTPYRRHPEFLHSGPRGHTELATLIGRFVNQVVANCLEAQGKSVFVEDNTWNILFAEELFAFTPQARLIHVYRHPRDVIASLIRQHWAPNDTIQASQWYRQVISRWFEVRQVLPAGRVLELRFEDLIQDFRTQGKRLAEFSGLELPDLAALINPEQAHIGRWKQDLSSNQIGLIAAETAQIERSLGYS